MYWQSPYSVGIKSLSRSYDPNRARQVLVYVH